jgi:tetratricopeptide (TPR) repeat protein
MMASARVRVWVRALAAIAGLGALVLAAASPASAQGAPSAGAPAGSVSDAAGLTAAETALSRAELDALIAPLGADSVDQRRAAAAALASLDSDAVPAVARKLAELRKTGDGGTYAAIKAVREHVGAGGDLLEALVASRPEASSTRALTTVSLLRGLAHAGTTPAVRQLVLLAPDAGGALRPELGRQVKQLGDRAVAALIEARRDPSPETRTWAANLLDAMGKHLPGDVVQTKDNQALADALRAYANIRDLDALPVVLSFVSSDRVQVRIAAREATLAYGQDALWRLREAYAALTGEPPVEGATAAELAKKLFDAYDRFRLRDVYALMDGALAAAKDGRTKDAVTAFDEALARQPLLDRRAEAAPTYVAYAESLEDSDRPAALAYLRKALRLDEAGPQSSHVRSAIATLEGEDLVAHGVSDTEPFTTALTLDPSNARARADLDRIESQVGASRSRGWRMLAAAIVLVAALVGIVLVGGHRRRAPAH